jgi:uncharacterized membrane protein
MNGAHLHIILVHLPIVLFPTALVLLVAHLRWSSAALRNAAYAIVFFSTAGAIGAYLTGEEAEEVIEHLQGVKESLIEEHEESALWALILSIACALMVTWQFAAEYIRKIRALPAIVLIILVALTSGILAWVGSKGGEIRHPEIYQAGGEEAKKEGPEHP